MRNSRPYFHPREFVGNNIEYRIGSSGALARFKESQTFTLDQVAFNPFHKFSTSAKEIILLKYDVWWDFLNELEQYFLMSHENGIYLSEILELAEIRTEYYTKTLRKQTKIIDQEYFEIWNSLHADLYNYLLKTIGKIVDTDLAPVSIFGSIVDTLSKVLSQTLFELQELDIIFYQKERTPEFSIDELGCNIILEDGTCLIGQRIKFLRKVRHFDEIIIKYYLNENIPFRLTQLHNILEREGIKYTIV